LKSNAAMGAEAGCADGLAAAAPPTPQSRLVASDSPSHRDESLAVRSYFSRSYPDRSSALARVFRRREDERQRLLRSWLPDCDGLDVLDAGAGDGLFLAGALRGKPAFLRLEDLVAANLRRAEERLRQRTAAIDACVTDVRDAAEPRRYDVVVAMGISDYVRDWEHLLEVLLRRTGDVLILDFPRADTLHRLARRTWLAMHGVALHASSRKRLDALLAPFGHANDVAALSYNWVVRLRVDRRGPAAGRANERE
jgi:hypothetical protein